MNDLKSVNYQTASHETHKTATVKPKSTNNSKLTKHTELLFAVSDIVE
jgi:hypothetical protein